MKKEEKKPAKKIKWEWDTKQGTLRVPKEIRQKKEVPDGYCRIGRQFYKSYGKLGLWRALMDAGVSYRDFATHIGERALGAPQISNLANHGIFPQGHPRRWYREKIETALDNFGIPVRGIWQPVPNELQCDYGNCRSRKAQARKRIGKEEIVRKEKILTSTLQHFKLFRDPFDRREESVENLFGFPGFRHAEEILLDAAHHAEFVALCGASGSGKTTLIKKLIAELAAEEKVVVILPRSFQKERLTVSAVCDAIVRTLAPSVTPKGTLEGKAWQVEGLLKKLNRMNMRAVLVIDEGHALTVQMLRYLKRFHEIEEGFVKLLGIILVGQEELAETLNEYTHHEIREVIKRCQKVELTGMNGSVPDYLAHRFSVSGADVSKVFVSKALEALGDRECTPLDVNNLAARAMNAAAAMGEEIVTEEIVWHVTA